MHLSQISEIKKNKFYCNGLCDLCIYKEYHGSPKGCNPSTLLDTVEKIEKMILNFLNSGMYIKKN